MNDIHVGLWRNVLSLLQKNSDMDKYKKELEQLQPFTFEVDTLYLVAPNEEVRDWCEKELTKFILDLASDVDVPQEKYLEEQYSKNDRLSNIVFIVEKPRILEFSSRDEGIKYYEHLHWSKTPNLYKSSHKMRIAKKASSWRRLRDVRKSFKERFENIDNAINQIVSQNFEVTDEDREWFKLKDYLKENGFSPSDVLELIRKSDTSNFIDIQCLDCKKSTYVPKEEFNSLEEQPKIHCSHCGKDLLQQLDNVAEID